MLVLGLAALMATMMALGGPSLAKDTEQTQTTYTDRVELRQFFADPPKDVNDEGQGGFRGSATDIADDPYPGLPGELDTKISCEGGPPGSEVTNTITGGKWMLCSDFKDEPQVDRTVDPPEVKTPECTSDSTISLTGTTKSGTATWEKDGFYATAGPLGQVWIGKAKFESILKVKGGTVNGKTVTGGSGTLEGTLDHTPILSRERSIVTGTMKVTLLG